MVKKTLLFNKTNRFKKSTLNKGVFFCDQHLLKNQISFADLKSAKTQEEEIAEKLGEASQEVSKQKSKKKKITSAITFAINIAVVVAILLFQIFNSDVQPFSEIIKAGHFKWYYVIIILISFALVMLLDTVRATMLLKKSSKRNRPFLIYKMNAIGK